MTQIKTHIPQIGFNNKNSKKLFVSISKHYNGKD